MDWYSWLSKSGLEPPLVYDYSLLFADNELEEDDITHFNHEFLLSMGVSIAKHRLEILKLAKTNNKIKQRFLNAVVKTKKRLSRYLHTIVVGRPSKCDGSSAIVVVPPQKPAHNARGNMLKRGKRLLLLKHRRLMITDGGVKIAARPGSNSVSHSASPMVYRCGVEEEMRWDSMFQDLKPT